MTEKKVKNPFEILSEMSGTRRIKVKALNNAEVEIKTSLTIAEEQDIMRTQFKNQEISGTSVIPNQADAMFAKIQTVSLILVEPKMTMTELGELTGASEAIDEIYVAYHKQKSKNEGN
jgi:hypothetical protein